MSDGWFDREVPRIQQEDVDYLFSVPGKAEFEAFEKTWSMHNTARLSYIKLHGSVDWVSKHSGNLKSSGGEKSLIIEREPPLHWYNQKLFPEVLSQCKKLLVIGYSFRDTHINSRIIDAVRDHSLNLFIVSPLLPSDFRASLLPVHGVLGNSLYSQELSVIWEALSGYFQGHSIDIMRWSDAELHPMVRSFLRTLGLI